MQTFFFKTKIKKCHCKSKKKYKSKKKSKSKKKCKSKKKIVFDSSDSSDYYYSSDSGDIVAITRF